MREPLEILAATVLAAGLGVALWPAGGGDTSAAGIGGEDIVSVSAANASIAAMVTAWETPAEVEEIDTPLIEPPTSPSEPPAPQEPLADPFVLPRAPEVPEAPVPPELVPSDTPLAELPEPPQLETPETVSLPTVAPEQPEEPEQDPAPEPQPEVTGNAPATSPRPPDRPEPKPAPRTAEQPAPASQARAEQKAAGSGGGDEAGTAGQTASASLSDGERATLVKRWGGQIRAQIARNVPRGAGKGVAVVEITIHGSGALISVRISRSSGNPKIDALALEAVHKAGRFPAAPKELGPGPHVFGLQVQSR